MWLDNDGPSRGFLSFSVFAKAGSGPGASFLVSYLTLLLLQGRLQLGPLWDLFSYQGESPCWQEALST